jgi:hypothetical protein
MERPNRKPARPDATPVDPSLEHYQQRALSQLAKSLGDEDARVMVRDALLEVGVEYVRNADDLLQLGERLISRGGVAEVVGRSIKVHAVLKGARSVEPEATPTASSR